MQIAFLLKCLGLPLAVFLFDTKTKSWSVPIYVPIYTAYTHIPRVGVPIYRVLVDYITDTSGRKLPEDLNTLLIASPKCSTISAELYPKSFEVKDFTL